MHDQDELFHKQQINERMSRLILKRWTTPLI